MCIAKRQKASRIEGKIYRKSNASMYHTCEGQKFEDPPSSEESMFYAEEIAFKKRSITMEAKLNFITSR